jgi:hypothetical protein
VLAPVPQWLTRAVEEIPENDRFVSYRVPERSIARRAVAPEARLHGIIARAASAVEGKRNSVTFWCACRIRDMLADGELDDVEGIAAFTALHEAAVLAGLRSSSVRKTIQSAVRS